VIGDFGNERTKRKTPRLTGRLTDGEIIRGPKSHDVCNRLKTGVSEVVEDRGDLDCAVRKAIYQDNTARLNTRLPPAMNAVLRKLARRRTPTPTLARIWLMERLEQELKAG